MSNVNVRGSPRPAVTLTLTRPRTFIMLHFATHAHDVPAFSSPVFSTHKNLVPCFPFLLFPPVRFGPVFSSPVFSTLRFGPTFSSPAFSTPVFFMVPRFPVPRFQRPQAGTVSKLMDRSSWLMARRIHYCIMKAVIGVFKLTTLRCKILSQTMDFISSRNVDRRNVFVKVVRQRWTLSVIIK